MSESAATAGSALKAISLQTTAMFEFGIVCCTCGIFILVAQRIRSDDAWIRIEFTDSEATAIREHTAAQMDESLIQSPWGRWP
jgi:hypothetical protein